MPLPLSGDLGFSHEPGAGGQVRILRHGRVVTILRDKSAADFLFNLAGLDHAARQQLMARLTGNYKRGNEGQAREHPRNQ